MQTPMQITWSESPTYFIYYVAFCVEQVGACKIYFSKKLVEYSPGTFHILSNTIGD